jgi:hypothetical protein
MIIGGELQHIEFERTDTVAEYLPSAGDFACSIAVLCNDFAGKVDNVYFAPEQAACFISDLRNLEMTRKGSAVLLNLSSQSESNPLRFEVASRDNLGNMIVRAELQNLSFVGDFVYPIKVQVVFGLEGEYLQKTLLDFERLFRKK